MRISPGSCAVAIVGHRTICDLWIGVSARCARRLAWRDGAIIDCRDALSSDRTSSKLCGPDDGEWEAP